MRPFVCGATHTGGTPVILIKVQEFVGVQEHVTEVNEGGVGGLVGLGLGGGLGEVGLEAGGVFEDAGLVFEAPVADDALARRGAVVEEQLILGQGFLRDADFVDEAVPAVGGVGVAAADDEGGLGSGVGAAGLRALGDVQQGGVH